VECRKKSSCITQVGGTPAKKKRSPRERKEERKKEGPTGETAAATADHVSRWVCDSWWGHCAGRVTPKEIIIARIRRLVHIRRSSGEIGRVARVPSLPTTQSVSSEEKAPVNISALCRCAGPHDSIFT